MDRRNIDLSYDSLISNSTYAVPRAFQSQNGSGDVGIADQKAIRAPGRVGEQADARVGNRFRRGGDDSDRGELESVHDFQASQAALLSYLGRDGAFVAHDGQLPVGAHQHHESAMRPSRQRRAGVHDGDGIASRVQLEIENH